MGQYANQMLMEWIGRLLERRSGKKKEKQDSTYDATICLIPEEIERNGKTRIMIPTLQHHLTPQEIRLEIERITNSKWRMIFPQD